MPSNPQQADEMDLTNLNIGKYNTSYGTMMPSRLFHQS